MTKDEVASHVVGVRLTSGTKHKLKALSDKYEVSISTLVRIAINRLVRDSEKGEGITLQ